MKLCKLLILFHEDENTKEEIQIVPMIDVMLFLLVFFMIYTINVIPMLVQEIKIPLSSTVEKIERKEPLRIYIDKDGSVVLDNRNMGLDALKSHLNKLIEREETSVLLVADREVNIQKIMEVIDVIKEVGIYKIGISGEKK